MSIDIAIERALKNIAKYGDTDVFPFLFERHLFFDKPKECKSLLQDMHKSFKTWLQQHPPVKHFSLTQVGYTGFRWATQIEPFWNAYYLALVAYLADQIEAVRIPVSERTVFSYRFLWSDADCKLFSDSNWNDYRERSLELAQDANFVVVTDISDFYPRVYHHRIENELNRLPAAGDCPKRLITLLNQFSNGFVSYGLPIGGPASRILAELALNSVDQHLAKRRISFCRYADDYSLFCKDRSDAYKILVLLSEKLFNEGLVLQKSKTKIIPSNEFQSTRKLLDPDAQLPTDEDRLLSINIRFDPYSPTAEEDYETLSAAVRQVDIAGILGREIAKTRIDTTVTKQAVSAVRAMEPAARIGALRTLLDAANLLALAPVFVTLMRTIRAIYDELDPTQQSVVDDLMVGIFDRQEHVLSVEVNLAYFVQAIARRHSRRKEEIAVEIYATTSSPIVRRLVICAMANWECHYWLSDLRQQFGTMNEWERRAFIVGSYCLGDEGHHFRDHTKDTWDSRDLLVRDWFAARLPKNKAIPQ